jgi:hypothetical protein
MSRGGLVMCGCTMNEKQGCANEFPNCPAIMDENSNFGAGLYYIVYFFSLCFNCIIEFYNHLNLYNSLIVQQ